MRIISYWLHKITLDIINNEQQTYTSIFWFNLASSFLCYVKGLLNSFYFYDECDDFSKKRSFL